MNRELKIDITDFTDIITLILPDDSEIRVNVKGIGNYFTDKYVEVKYKSDDIDGVTNIRSVFNIDNPSQSKSTVISQPVKEIKINNSPLTMKEF